MKCTEIRELLPDLAAGLASAAPEVDLHLRSCAGCAGTLAEFRKTMALLDEWQAPEPSPYFDTRLQARLREEKTGKSSNWLAWLRRPALAASMALLLLAGVSLFRSGPSLNDSPNAVLSWDKNVTEQPGTAVGDLQTLDNNHELYADFDILDELDVQQNTNQ